MSERPRISTMINPPGLPPDFNWGNFIRALTMLDMSLRGTLEALKKALERKDETEVARLAITKKQQEEAVTTFLTQAYESTNGKIAEVWEFDLKNERRMKLAIEDDGQLLWLKIKYKIQQMREERERKIMEIIPE